METFDRKKHWENVYQTKNIEEVSWYQEVPSTSLEIFKDLDLAETSGIIDIGGGDSLLVDNLSSLGFKNLTVLDISGNAIEKAKQFVEIRRPRTRAKIQALKDWAQLEKDFE